MKKVLTSSFLTLALLLSVVAVQPAYAQTGTTTTDVGAGATTGTGAATTDTTASPALPDTGFGGNASTNTAILLATGAIAIVGGSILARRYATR